MTRIFSWLNTLRPRHFLWLALVVRLGFCGIYTLTNPWEQVPVRDEWYTYAGTDGYIQLARTLITDDRWAYYPQAPTVHNRPPLHPLLLAATAAWDADHWYLWCMLAAIALQMGAMGFLLQSLRLLQVPRTVTHATLLAFALHPYLVGICRASTFVPLAIFLSCALLWAALRCHTRPSVGATLLCGLLVGLLALTHGTFILLIGLLPVLFWGRFKAMGLATLMALLTILPWTLWNLHAHNRFIPVATGAGIQYWKGEAWLTHTPDLERRVFHRHTGSPLRQTYFGPDAPQDDATLLHLAWQDVQARPLAFLWRTAKSYALFWLPNDRSPWKQALTWVLNLPLLLVAGWLLWQKRRTWWQHPTLRSLTLWWVLLPLPFALLAAITGYFIMLLPLLMVWVAAVYSPHVANASLRKT